MSLWAHGPLRQSHAAHSSLEAYTQLQHSCRGKNGIIFVVCFRLYPKVRILVFIEYNIIIFQEYEYYVRASLTQYKNCKSS